jgi:DNA (cytosine-5)-methyltransferase 1
MSAYYNEHDPYAAQWLRNLIKAGHIADGEVDERSIEDVRPSDLAGFTQCHFFAGVGGWPHASRLAGWPDDRPVWTGSCPCQSFSFAGKGAGFSDERHLWPAWHNLIVQCSPSIIFGEQVDAAIRFGWLDLVQTDLEALGYAFGSAIIPAAGVGAPHGRHRIFFVADADHKRLQGRGRAKLRQCADERPAGKGGDTLRLADADMPDQDSGRAPSREQPLCDERSGCAGTVDHTESEQARVSRLARERRATGGHWADADWLPCQGGKWRPIEPGTFPLAHGIPGRMGRLRAYGNAIVPQVAEAFIRAAL